MIGNPSFCVAFKRLFFSIFFNFLVALEKIELNTAGSGKEGKGR
jgi:hypothetical protein